MRPIRMMFTVLLPGIAVGISCNSTITAPSFPSSEDVAETVMRYQLFKNGSGYIHNGVVNPQIKYFVLASATCDTTQNYYPVIFDDLPESFMNRFRDAARPVIRYSQAKIEPGGIVTELQTGDQALLFWVGPIRRQQIDRVEAEGGYRAGGRNAEGDIFYLSLRAGIWSVDSVKWRWVS